MPSSWHALPIRKKLYVSSGALLCIFAVWLAIELVFINRQVDVVTDTMALRLTQSDTEELRHWLIWTDDKGSYAILAQSPQSVGRFVDDYNHGMATVKTVLQRLDTAQLEPQDQELLAQFKSWLTRYDTQTRRSLAAKMHGDELDARSIYISVPTEPGDSLADRLTLDLHEDLDRASSSMISDAQLTLLITGVAGFVAIVLGILVTVFMAEVLTSHGSER